MNLAVLTYAFAPSNPDGLPDGWPYEIIQLGDEALLPGPNWLLMTDLEYKTYVTDHQPEYETWKSNATAAAAPQKQIDLNMAALSGAVAKFVEKFLVQIQAENKALGVVEAGMVGTMIGLMSNRVLLDGYPYEFSLLDTLKVRSLSETIKIIDYYITNIQTYEVPVFFTSERLEVFKARIQTFLEKGV